MSDELVRTSTTVVLAHVLMSDFGVIGATARTLGDRWDDLPPLARARMLDMIFDTVASGMDRLKLFMSVVPEADPAG